METEVSPFVFEVVPSIHYLLTRHTLNGNADVVSFL